MMNNLNVFLTGTTVAEAPELPETAETVETIAVETLPATDLRLDLFPLWIGLSVLLGMILCAAGFALWQKRRKKKQKSYPTTQELPATASDTVEISKLHEQGARSSQQDSFATSPMELFPTKGLLAVVCDGMGGLQHGDKVSQAAVTAMLGGFVELQGDPQRLLLGLLARANRAVNHMLGPAGQRHSGTTMVAGILKDHQFSYLSVGDSRICLYRGGQLIQLNREHIYSNDLAVDAVNEQMSFREVWSHSQQGALTSFLGMGDLRHVDIPAQSLPVLSGDKLILMSDGVYNALTREELIAALALPCGEDTAALQTAISEKNYEQQDNYTAVVLTIPTA